MRTLAHTGASSANCRDGSPFGCHLSVNWPFWKCPQAMAGSHLFVQSLSRCAPDPNPPTRPPHPAAVVPFFSISEGYNLSQPTRMQRRDLKSGTQQAQVRLTEAGELVVDISWQVPNPGACWEGGIGVPVHSLGSRQALPRHATALHQGLQSCCGTLGAGTTSAASDVSQTLQYGLLAAPLCVCAG